jgi:hypothetical protein
MKEVKNIDWIKWAEIATGVFFLFNIGSDIQLGFGLVLIAIGLNRK